MPARHAREHHAAGPRHQGLVEVEEGRLRAGRSASPSGGSCATLGAVDLEHDRVALAAAGADRGARRGRRRGAAARGRGRRRCGAPEAPIGWPSAIAPPLTLTLSSSTPSIRTELSATEAKASLISQRSTSSGRLADLLQRLLGRVGRGLGQVGEVVGDLAVAEHGRDRLLAVLLGPLLGGDHDRRGAVVDARGVARRVGGVVAADRLQLGEGLEVGVGADRLVGLDDGVALAALDGDADDLLGEPALLGRLVRRAGASAPRSGPCRRG